jgi:Leucine-rich repeat (LRR) protein
MKKYPRYNAAAALWAVLLICWLLSLQAGYAQKHTTALPPPVSGMSSKCDPARDRQALTELYQALGGPNWTIKTGWLTAPNLKDWYGIKTNAEGCVTHLDLDGNNFIGYSWTPDPPGNNLQGTLPTAIGAFSELERLSLAGNRGLTGLLPDAIGGLEKMNAFYIRLCNLKGPLPASFFNLSYLVDVDFYKNPLNMTLVADWSKLKRIEGLTLSDCGITGTIPPEMGLMDSLYSLSLCCNKLRGAIPNTFRQLKNLQSLSVTNNDLTNIPNLTNLSFKRQWDFWGHQVNLYGNGLTFEDLEPNMPLAQIKQDFFRYIPQDTVFHDTLLTRTVGQNLDFSLDFDENVAANQYRWSKNGTEQTAQHRTGNNDLEITNLQPTHAGIWTVQVTNPNVPGLTLNSRRITLQVNTCTTVTTTADSGTGSLREAINCANTNPGPDKIRFEIPGSGPHVIAIQTGLPTITDNETVIDGSTQAQGRIIIDGINMNQGEMIYAQKVRGFEVYGLILRNSRGNGIALVDCTDFIVGAPGKGNIVYGSGRLDTPYPYDHAKFGDSYNPDIILFNCSNGKVQSNQVGITENNGLPTRPVSTGIAVSGQNILIGGNRSANEGNTVGNCYFGISAWSITGGAYPATTDIRINGNNIGTDAAGIRNFGNSSGSDFYNNVSVCIGDGPDQANVYKFNEQAFGVSGTGLGQAKVRFNQNIFSCNAGALDVKTVPKHPLTIQSAATNQVKGVANSGDLVEVYRSVNTSCPTAACQGSTYLGSTTADASGQWTLDGSFPLGASLTATATAIAAGWTWGFAGCKTVQSAVNPCRQQDSLELVKLYEATNDPGWTNKWDLSKPMTTWYGIRLNTQGCVQCIDMDGTVDCGPSLNSMGNNLSGVLPDLSFGALTALLLPTNRISGIIPNFNMPNLRVLSLSGNRLSGPIPNFNMPNLQLLYLNNNQLSGPIPNFNMPKLEILHLHNNRLTQLPVLTNLPLKRDTTYIRGLRANNNRLTFRDILSNISFAQTATFGYAPQDSVFRDTTFTRKAGESLTINLGIDAGISDNSYAWYKNGALWRTVAGNNTLTFNNIQTTDAGTYYVRVTNPRAPLLTLYGRRVRIQVNCAGGAMSLSSSGLLCTGSSVTLTAPAGFAQYRWSTGAVTNTVTASSNGTYAVTVTDAAGCTNTATMVLTARVAPIAGITGSRTICGSPIALDAGAGFAQYRWSGGSTARIFSTNSAGTYTVTVTDVAGCTASATAVLTAGALAVPSLAGIPSFCAGSSTSITASAGFSQYRWSSGQSVAGISVSTAGTFIVTVTNAAGCTGTAAVTVTQNAAVSAAVTGATSICPGKSTTLNATAGQSAYRWSGGQTTQNIVANAAGTYTVTVTAATGCTATATSTVAFSPLPTLTASATGATCTATGSNGGAVVTTGAGTAPFSFLWNNGAITQNLNNISGGTYTVTVTDSRQCTATATVVVRSGTLPQPSAVAKAADCDKTNGSINLSVASGNPPYQYRWSNGSTGEDILGLGGGTYTVTVTDQLGCTTTTQVLVTQVKGPAMDHIAFPAHCGRSDGTLNLLISGSFPFRIRWSTGDTSSINLEKLSPGAYTVTVSDRTGCSTVYTMALPAQNGPSATATITQPDCTASNGRIVLQVTPGPSGTPQFIWSDQSKERDRNNLATGIYTVTVYDNVCPFVLTNNLTGNAPVVAAAATEADCGRPSGRITLGVNGGTPPYNFRWQHGPAQKDLQNLAVGIYTVTVADSKQCRTITTVTIKAAGNPTAGKLSAKDDVFFVSPDKTEYKLPVLVNDTIGKGLKVLVRTVRQPRSGNVEVTNQNELLYRQLSANVPVADSLLYELCDAACPGRCDTARIKLIWQRDISALKELIPNAISPNGDGVGDVFDPLETLRQNGVQVDESKAQLIIFNRNQDRLYRAKPYQPWEAARITAGPYWYTLEVELDGQKEIIKGEINVFP